MHFKEGLSLITWSLKLWAIFRLYRESLCRTADMDLTMQDLRGNKLPDEIVWWTKSQPHHQSGYLYIAIYVGEGVRMDCVWPPAPGGGSLVLWGLRGRSPQQNWVPFTLALCQPALQEVLFFLTSCSSNASCATGKGVTMEWLVLIGLGKRAEGSGCWTKKKRKQESVRETRELSLSFFFFFF